MKTKMFVCGGFALASAPVILYSVYRTGYQIVQVASNGVLPTLWQHLTFTVIALVVLSFVVKRPTVAIIAGIAIAAAAMAVVKGSVFWEDDYKVWVYVIGPLLFWSLVLATLTTAVAFLFVERPASWR